MVGDIVFVVRRKRKKQRGKCTICKIPMIFYDFKDDLEKNMFIELFLKDYNEKWYHHLMELFDTNKSALCCFLDEEYHHKGRDRCTGETWDVPLSEQKRYEEDIKINQMKQKTQLNSSLRLPMKKIVYLIVYLNFNYCLIICTYNCEKIKVY